MRFQRTAAGGLVAMRYPHDPCRRRRPDWNVKAEGAERAMNSNQGNGNDGDGAARKLKLVETPAEETRTEAPPPAPAPEGPKRKHTVSVPFRSCRVSRADMMKLWRIVAGAMPEDAHTTMTVRVKSRDGGRKTDLTLQHPHQLADLSIPPRMRDWGIASYCRGDSIVMSALPTGGSYIDTSGSDERWCAGIANALEEAVSDLRTPLGRVPTISWHYLVAGWFAMLVAGLAFSASGYPRVSTAFLGAAILCCVWVFADIFGSRPVLDFGEPGETEPLPADEEGATPGTGGGSAAQSLPKAPPVAGPTTIQ